MRSKRRIVARLALLLLAAVCIFGCGRGPKTYSVRGKVDLAGANVKQLAGGYIEAALVSDPKVRASGEIQPDGRFKLDTLHAGAILSGARAGSYEVRIILTDDNRERPHQAAVVAPRFLDFKTSGLLIDVPTRGEITIAVTAQ